MKFEAFVVVGADDRICDANGQMPDALRNDAEWQFFQAGLDAADVTVLGRHSHEATPNHKARRRLILTRTAGSARSNAREVFWTPETTPLATALAAFDHPVDHLAVAGGQAVFDQFLTGPYRYTRFHLSRIDGVILPGGRSVFSACETAGRSAEQVLRAHGYRPGPVQRLDRTASVVSWTVGTVPRSNA